MAQILKTLSNADDGLSAFVFVSAHGGHGVSFRDDDAGESIGVSYHGLTFDAAVAKAEAFVGQAPAAAGASTSVAL